MSECQPQLTGRLALAVCNTFAQHACASFTPRMPSHTRSVDKDHPVEVAMKCSHLDIKPRACCSVGTLMMLPPICILSSEALKCFIHSCNSTTPRTGHTASILDANHPFSSIENSLSKPSQSARMYFIHGLNECKHSNLNPIQPCEDHQLLSYPQYVTYNHQLLSTYSTSDSVMIESNASLMSFSGSTT